MKNEEIIKAPEQKPCDDKGEINMYIMKLAVTRNGKTKIYTGFKSYEIAPIYNGVELCVTYEDNTTVTTPFYNEKDEWEIKAF